MSLVCRLFGHKFRVRKVNVLRRLQSGNLHFNNERFHKAYEMTRNTSLDPEKEYVCRRCGEVVSGYNKFLMFYMFL